MTLRFPRTIPELITERLLLKPIQSCDLDDYHALCRDERVMALYGVLPHQSHQETTQLIRHLEQQFHQKKSIRWGVFLQSKPQQLIGDVGFWRFVPERLRAEVGAKLKCDFWGQGLMPEAIQRVLHFGIEQMNLNSIEGHVDPSHLVSENMLVQLGFVKEGELKKHTYNAFKKEFCDTYLYTYRNQEHV